MQGWERERERRRGARLLVEGVGGKRVWNAGTEAAGEMVREPGGDAPPRGERHGWAGAWRRARGRRRGAGCDEDGAGERRPEASASPTSMGSVTGRLAFGLSQDWLGRSRH